MKPSLRGKVRPIINNLQLQAGNKYYDVIWNVTDKKQLYSGSKTSIKCYIKRTIDVNTQCRLYSYWNVTITSNSKDIFGNIVISTEVININIKTMESFFWWYKNNINPCSWNASKYKLISFPTKFWHSQIIKLKWVVHLIQQ